MMLTDLSFLQPGQPWPPETEKPRLRRYQDGRDLFSGDHQRVFRDWVRLIRHDESAALEFVLNYPKRLSTLWADLLLGERPRFTVDGIEAPPSEQDESGNWIQPQTPEQEWLDETIVRTDLIPKAYQVAIDMSRFGDGLFKIGLENRQATIDGQTPQHWFPVVSPDDATEVQQHILAWDVKRSSNTILGREIEDRFLRVQVHERGRVENQLYRIDGTGAIGPQLDLAIWDPELVESWDTGIDDFLIVPAPNLQTTETIFGIDDYSDLFTILQEMAVRVGQISRVLDKHADPSMYGSPNSVEVDPRTGQHVFHAGGRWFPITEGETPPGYITWDGQLNAAFEELELLQQQLYIISETSPAAFGQMQHVVAESGTALRRLMMVPLAKVNRVRLFFDPALCTALEVCARLERAHGNTSTPEIPGVEIEWHDGLPEDPKEAAEIERMRRQAGTTSIYSAISRQDGGSDASIRQELDRIREEQAAEAGASAAGIPPLSLQFGGLDDDTEDTE